MKAVALTRYLPIDHPEALLDVELPRPPAQGHDLLVRVEAVSVNPVDTKVRSPKDKVESSPRVLGWDAAGVVEAVGPDVTLFQPGDAVYYAGDITRQGSNSEYQLVDERIVGHKPASLDFAAAAALPLTAITAYEGLFARLGLDSNGADAGKSLLVIGGAGGVGSLVIQFAKLAGLTVIATAGRPHSADWCRQLGADLVLDRHHPLIPVLTLHGHPQVDYIFNAADTDGYWETMGEAIRPQGRIVTIVENRGPLAQDQLKLKSATHVWEFMFTRPMYRTPDQIEQHHLLETVAGWIDSGRVKGTLSETWSPINAENLRRAHRLLESGSMVGKLVLQSW
ncbi:zinc-binding alcohol dehydrogenase family protein [Pseudogulbenkiania sp. NH8B]|uniref:zinc-binding alcohol dehydrogenase family protein n=1 Tax=Pseudogulbenkiania sp. (strain NH8B) TaxID=748280 RepID=UPI0002279D48|nr:zinc-binding alcohol dehydrogenase family protein [Pseudogulbenkiania sp. NH8B]BAK76009.1 zinc-binding alcohol dehydrogenase family protein [Pseudogulbenkiania sp. NH8B]